MCNTGLLKAGATYRANNPPHQNEALHVHAHTCPPPEEYTLLLSCSYCDVFSDRSTNFLLSFVWPGFEPAPLVGAPSFFFGRHRGPGFEPAPSYFLFRF